MFDPPIEIPGSSDCQRLEDELHKEKAEIARLRKELDVAENKGDTERLRTVLVANQEEWSATSGTLQSIAALVIHCLVKERNELRQKADRLRAIVDKLPKTADGVPVVLAMTVWWILPSGRIGNFEVYSIDQSCFSDCDRVRVHHARCYSTREAAEAAKEEKHDCGD